MSQRDFGDIAKWLEQTSPTPKLDPAEQRRRRRKRCVIQPMFPRGGNAEHDALAKFVTGAPVEYLVITPEGASKQFDGMDEAETLYDVKTKHDFLRILDLPEARLTVRGAASTAAGVSKLRTDTLTEVLIADHCGYDFRMATNNPNAVQLMREILGDIIDPDKIELVNFRFE